MKLTDEEMQLILKLRSMNPAEDVPSDHASTFGEKIADKITGLLGSWTFLITQTIIFSVWVVANIMAFVKQWDPYPFILLNLMLSFQAAYAGPILLMSGNREAKNDRKKLEYTYYVNVKTELEIELLHHKIDKLMEKLE
jgi:uncharacterized membrane protein